MRPLCDGWFQTAGQVWGEAWGNRDYMVTKPVTLKALLRICADLAAQDPESEEGRLERWHQRLAP
jgi:hypothetical protein